MTTYRRLPPHLLAPYVADAASDVAAGRPIDEWSTEALDDALRQLGEEHVAMSGGAVGVAPTATSSSLHLAALVLEREPTTAAATPQEELARSSARLGELIAELEATRRGDPGAAAHVAEIFEEISDRVLAGDSDPIFA